MRLMEALISVVVVMIGTLMLGVGYLVNLEILSFIGVINKETGIFLQDAGFIMIVSGFLSWIIMYIFREAGAF